MSDKLPTADSFQNFAARVGIGTDNLQTASTYGFNPISRNRLLLEWMYRGSWLVRQAVDAPADDMTRAGIEIESDLPPERIDRIYQAMDERGVWSGLNETIKWARLYGGCIAMLAIEGQATEAPLRMETIQKQQFQGLMVLDRWMISPTFSAYVKAPGLEFGQPEFYDVVADGGPMARMRIHHSRVIRLEGADLPYWQRMTENGWGLSVLEPFYDRMVAFDSATNGAGQLIYKAHLRTLKLPQLRELIASGGKAMDAVLAQVELMRRLQSNEGISLIDGTDEFEAHSYTFSGLSDMLIQFGQQISGALQIPLVRLFGQSPAGMNSTGESDLRNYYDAINAGQNRRLRPGLTKLLRVLFRSEFAENVPEGFHFRFRPLWQMSDKERAEVGEIVTRSVVGAYDAGLVSQQVAMRELRQGAAASGLFSNITDEEIAEADEELPVASELLPTDADDPEALNKPPASEGGDA